MKLLLAGLLAAAMLAGCATSETGPEPTTTSAPLGDYAVGPGPYMAGPALWDDPQNFPHPKWGWATLSSPSLVVPNPSWAPINNTMPASITGFEHLAQASEVTQGAGIAVFGSLVFVPGEGAGSWVVDISDPAHPNVLSTNDSPDRGCAIVAYPDGRLVAVCSAGGGFDMVEMTDPRQSVIINHTDAPTGGHKLGVVPGTPILYNAGSSGGEPLPNPVFGPGLCNVSIDQCVGSTEVYNLTDPEHPVLVQQFQNGLSCHHIFFWNSLTKQRAICAGIQYTQIWDTADPENPRVIVNVPVHHGVAGTPSAMLSIAAFSHTAGLSRDGTILYVGDENMGGGLPPGCLIGTELGAGEGADVGNVGTPIGATWFYDVSTETSPLLAGYFSPPRYPEVPSLGSCTTHHGRLVPDPQGRDLLAMSYYNDGVILIDFTGIGAGTLPKQIAQFHDGTNTWETWYYNGHLITGDLARGMDVYQLT